jgi:tetratricopeptide (TPR) repeat protein
MTVVGPTWSSAKSFYALQALLPLCAFAAAGWEWMEPHVGRICTIVLASLLGLWVLNNSATYWIDPKSTQTILMRGVGYGTASEWTKARLEMARAVKEHPESSEALLFLGFVDSALGDAKSAEKNYLAALRSKPSDAQIHVLLADLLEQSGRTAESIDHLRLAILLEPKLPDAYNELARFLMMYDGTSIEKSKEALQMAMRGCELTLYRNPTAMLGLADAYNRVGNRELALKTRSEAHRIQGDILVSQNNTGGGIGEYGQALQIDPANSTAHRNLDQSIARMNNRIPNQK